MRRGAVGIRCPSESRQWLQQLTVRPISKIAFAEHRPRGGIGGLAEQLKSAPATEQRPDKPSSAAVVSADRNFLLANSGSGHIVVHDHRDLKFLRRVTAGGVAMTLMSSSGLAYAISLDLGALQCGGFALQTLSAGLCLAMYLRSYVARAVLDARRSRLLVTGCGLFGEPLQSVQEFPLMSLRPGASMADHYIRFRARGSPVDPSSWIWYRIPRMSNQEEGAARTPGAQVGFTPAPRDAAVAHPPAQKLSPPSKGSDGRRFPGAGLGSTATDDGFGSSSQGKPAVVGPRQGAKANAAESDASAAVQRRSLADLRLLHGLPADAREEQKIVDFFDDPMAFAPFNVRQ